MEITLCSDKITELAKVMIQVQQTLTPVLKDSVNDLTNSSYASLKSVMEVCRTALLEHGIWMTQYAVSVEKGHLGLVTKIIHAATGQWQSSLIEMPLPKNDPQGYGSAMTYARRYSLSALLGIITEDDDAESATPKQETQNHEINPVKTGNKIPAKSQKQQPQYSDTGADGLPKLDGVNYRKQAANDGKTCILATGNTHSKKEFLKTAGFRWDGDKKIWWRYANAA
ncbi:MAG: ERF family protein [Proteobacteria bacterium]|nr:ERF family protein [Pseudomonadota bacterium]MBU1387890.1 ERF family protein [Pseudomonadota bacterium]MBU1544336.1 ERF family protein [Pseudomonadota bacterium]MBU2430073.1 ERF family protein [Pseudomonadota bacterium]MBU2482659.1 ERF family protein [Pseudomonadota bacterium]